MKNILRYLFASFILFSFAEIKAFDGKCGDKLKWTCDGTTLTITCDNGNSNYDNEERVSSKKSKDGRMFDYGMKKSNLAPWTKKGLDKKVRTIKIGRNVKSIGACAFVNFSELTRVEIEGNLEEIGWGAFFGCSRLYDINFPKSLTRIGKIAFAKCKDLVAVIIPEDCNVYVEDYAFMSCYKISRLSISRSAHIGKGCFISEHEVDGAKQYSLYTEEIQELPHYINEGNCSNFGISSNALPQTSDAESDIVSHKVETRPASDIDIDIPETENNRSETVALIIGNEKYLNNMPRVPYAEYDAWAFKNYCIKTLGLPANNIFDNINATKVQFETKIDQLCDHVKNLKDKDKGNVKIIVYYAGHALPDIESRSAYLLPIDCNDAKHGYSLHDLYGKLDNLHVDLVTCFLDACFTGISRSGESLFEGQRDILPEVEEETLSGNMVIFSAANAKETAQSYESKGHGIFTYFLCKKLQESKGELNYGDLSEYIWDNVTEVTAKNSQRQHPTTTASPNIQQNWRNISF